jgi:broad specificity phosphatase PhoE
MLHSCILDFRSKSPRVVFVLALVLSAWARSLSSPQEPLRPFVAGQTGGISGPIPQTPSDVSKDRAVHFLRHCIAAHNVAPAGSCLDGALFDASLTPQGLADAHALGWRLRQGSPPTDAVFFVSSLNRALQTASEFRDAAWDPARAPQVIVMDELREVYVPCSSAKRGTASAAAARFPSFNFSAVPEIDPMLTRSTEESGTEVRRRFQVLLERIKVRPERDVFVVSHGSLLDTLLQGPAAEAGLVSAPPASPLALQLRFSAVSGAGKGDAALHGNADESGDLAFAHCSPRTFVWAGA